MVLLYAVTWKDLRWSRRRRPMRTKAASVDPTAPATLATVSKVCGLFGDMVGESLSFA